MLDVKYARTDVLVRHTDGHTASQPARQAGRHTYIRTWSYMCTDPHFVWHLNLGFEIFWFPRTVGTFQKRSNSVLKPCNPNSKWSFLNFALVGLFSCSHFFAGNARNCCFQRSGVARIILIIVLKLQRDFNRLSGSFGYVMSVLASFHYSLLEVTEEFGQIWSGANRKPSPNLEIACYLSKKGRSLVEDGQRRPVVLLYHVRVMPFLNCGCMVGVSSSTLAYSSDIF